MLLVKGPESVYNAMILGGEKAIKLSLSLLVIYAICMSIIDIMDKIGLSKLIAKSLNKITKKLFRGEDDKTTELIGMNFSMNLLGIGGAATPLGIDATNRMCKDRKKATPNAILFMVINATSIQLLPTTIIGMRAGAGSTAPSNIILPALISTTIATLVGIVLCKIFSHD